LVNFKNNTRMSDYVFKLCFWISSVRRSCFGYLEKLDYNDLFA